MNRPFRALAMALLFVAAISPGLAGAADRQEDPMSRLLFPPDLIMEHQQEIGLRAEQRKAMEDEIHQAQLRFVDLQWKMKGEGEKLQAMLRASPIDETRALSQVDRVLDVEREIKKTQLRLLIRVKNELSPEQQARLAELRKASGK
jgi:Spy/CpxP family protein refolding chaperone